MNEFAQNNIVIKKFLAATALLALLMSSFPGAALAIDIIVEGGDVALSSVEIPLDINSSSENVTICHATASQNNPYVQQAIDSNAIINPSGHGNSGINVDDIIPPFGDYSGQNWTPTNQAIYDNDCDVPTDVEVVPGCTDATATNYNPLATVDDDSCISPDPVLYCQDDGALNYQEEGECEYEDGREVITACKYSTLEEPIEGWGMLISNDVVGEGEVTFNDLVTGEDGCVSVSVYPEDGPFYVIEEDREGWVQESVYGTNGQVFEGQGGEYCEFFDYRESVKEIIIDAPDSVISEEESGYGCYFYNQEPEEPSEIINTCLVPNTLGDESEFVLGSSGEKTVAQMLAEHGYVAVDTTNDQINYQVWDVADPLAATISFNLKVLGKRAGNTQILGYYKAGDGSTYSAILTQVSDTDGEVSIPVTIPAAFASSFGFAIQSDDKTWYSENALNSDAEDHVAVYNPAANTYILAFEDFDGLGDGDYNDIVMSVSDVTCIPADDEPVNPDPVVNSCVIPDALGNTEPFVLLSSGEKTIAEMMAEYGYTVNPVTDQKNYQVWNIANPATDSVTFNLRVLGKRAGNTQILGYYKAGDSLTFTSVLTQVTDTDGEASIPVTIPAAFASSFGFAIQSESPWNPTETMTWYSENALNSDSLDHVAVYNPVANTYILAFEDIYGLDDQDYNDLVIEVANVNCLVNSNDDNSTDGESVSNSRRGGGGVSRTSLSTPVPTVAGDSISAPEPAPLVLGEQVTAVPYGAPGTGRGGSSTDANYGFLLSFLIVLAAFVNRQALREVSK